MNKRRLRRWLKNPRFQTVDGLSRRVGAWIANHLSPNEVTLIGIALCVPMFIAFLFDEIVVGTIFLTFSFLTDFIDGALARYQQGSRHPMTLAQELRLGLHVRVQFRGVTHLGRLLDPVADKIRFFLALVPLGASYVQTWLFIALIAVALLLTGIRPIKEQLGLDDSASNRFGKFKIFAEIFGLALLLFLPGAQNVIGNVIAVNAVLTIAFLLGLCSLAGQIFTGYMIFRRHRRLRRVKTARADY